MDVTDSHASWSACHNTEDSFLDLAEGAPAVGYRTVTSWAARHAGLMAIGTYETLEETFELAV